jgi:hypothetical protein
VQEVTFEAEMFKAKQIEDRLPLQTDLRPPSLLGSKDGGQIDTSSSLPTTAPATSFCSNASIEPSRIFSPPDGQTVSSSDDTSFHRTDPHLGSQDMYPCSPGTAEALDRSFHEATELIEVDHPPGLNFEVPYLPELSTLGPFQEPRALFPPEVSFRKRYELLRISQSADLSISDLISSTLSCGDDYQKIWASASALATSPASKLPDRGKAQAWELARGTYQDDTKEQSVILSGKLEWNKPGVQGLFHLQLQPLKLEEGCLFHRAYGSDRFMSISMPSLSRYYLPDHLKHRYEAVHASVTEWLATCEHNIAGRTWKAFFVEGAKRRWRNRTRDTEESKKREKNVNILGFKIHLFAIDGIDFLNAKGPSPPECPSGSHIRDSIENFLMWHIPIGANTEFADCKIFQRFSLGLSQTRPTVILEPSEFAHIGNQLSSPDGLVMNDGCARISATLGRAITDKLGLEEVPSVFQARIAGAKGVWMVDQDELFIQTYPKQMKERKFCIEVSDLQLKIEPHPMERLGAHPTQRTFAVVGWSNMPRPASLNFQILAVLHDRGVKKEVLTELLLADHCQHHETLFQAMNSRLRLREWIEQNRTSVRGQEDIPFVGAWPDEVDEQIIMFLESGFMPQDCPLLLERIQSCLKKNLTKYVDKLKIRVPQSAYFYCIADPYSVLKPDEVHVGFSETWKDPLTGLSTTILDGIDVLVGRLPALLPSAIQRRRAAWRKELQQFRNVIVFPSTGNVCLATMLSGGDYDGDRPWVCWDQRIVEAFQNVEVPTDLPSKTDCNLVSRSRDLTTIFSDVSKPPFRHETEDFFRGCFRFNLYPSLIGTCTLEHEKVSYHESGLSGEGAKKLAALSSYLVDSSKNGYFLSNQDWQKFRNAISPFLREKPAYKEDEKMPVPKDSNVIDFLKFRVAEPQKDKTLTEFHSKWPRMHTRYSDPALTAIWRTTKQKASPDLARVLQQLETEIKAVSEEWRKGIPKDAKFKGNSFELLVARLHQKFSGIEPLQSEHEMSARWISETGEASCHWNLLRASCLYSRFPSWKMCWFLAGQDLCRIKITATGLSRAVLLDLYKTYRPDKKIVRRLANEEDDQDDAEEVVDD